MDRISGFGPEDLGSIPSGLNLRDEKMNERTKKYVVGSSTLIGMCIGAGVLGIPYVASRAGFLVSVFYLLFIGGMVLLLNLYLGETALRTKRNHQLTGYARKYLGKKAGKAMNFAILFGGYAAIVAYLVGVGDSISFLVFGNLNYSLLFGVAFGIFMSVLLWHGTRSLKRYEKYGVLAILFLLSLIFFIFIGKVDYGNLGYINLSSVLVPFGVILFAFSSESAIPIVSLIIKEEKTLMKKIIFTSSIVSIFFYLLFTFVVFGAMGSQTPEIATFALGSVFVILGIFTMFTSHLSLGNALEENFQFDDRFKKSKSWFFVCVAPVLIYVVVSFFQYFSFIKILSIGGVFSGGAIGILSLFLIKSAKLRTERKPEYSIPINWVIISIVAIVFIAGVFQEVSSIIKGI